MDDADDLMSSRVVLKGKEVENVHNLLEISLSPSVPASLRNIPTKYNIIVRLCTYAFHKLLESLRRAAFVSPLALEHLQDFIYYAYTFHTGLLEEPSLKAFKSGWMEALGDLAWCRMAVAAMVNGDAGGQGGLTIKVVDLHDTLQIPRHSVELTILVLINLHPPFTFFLATYVL
jgi:protein SMG6